LTAIGCEPAPAHLVEHLGHGHKAVVTQTDLAELMDEWEEASWLGRQPVKEVVMIQCAGSPRPAPPALLLAHLLHDRAQAWIRMRTLLPGDEGDDLLPGDARRGGGLRELVPRRARAGVEFLRGTPSEVQFDGEGRPVIEVEDVTAAEKKILRPDLVVLSVGMVPVPRHRRLADVLGVDLDEDGFIDILDRKNRATETSGEGISYAARRPGRRRWWSATRGLGVASEIHNFLSSAGRKTVPASLVDAAKCVGCDTCQAACPFGAISLIERPSDAARPAR